MQPGPADIATLPPVDVAVVGTGPAGITVARKLAAAGRSVALLEGGGEARTERSQSLYQGEVVGDPYFALDASRLRYFGGTSNHWGGWCRTLDAHDFEAKAGLAHTAWPIGKADLDPYLAEAREILEIPPIAPDEPIRDTGFKVAHFVFSPPVRFAAKYGAALKADPQIRLILDASVTRLETDGARITGLRVVGPDDRATTVQAGQVVLATGGIETSRLLLWSNETSGGRVVKQPATLGRYWMEHPHHTLGLGLVARRWLTAPSVCRSPILALTREALAEAGVLSCGLRLPTLPEQDTRGLLDDLTNTAPRLGRRLRRQYAAGTVCGVVLNAAWEQEPRSENRVALSDRATDRLGVPRPVLHWRKSPLDRRTAKVTAARLGALWARADLGRVRLEPWLRGEGDYPSDGALAGHHHMGGTRMAARPEAGVVDATGRVFGQANLYVAGSSVFPSSGHANPTLTIVQLALRLAEHLRRVT
jgi:choline dehydrogenase-like flavoprotein